MSLPPPLRSPPPCQVTTYQQQYFYTDSLEDATHFVRAIADDIKRPFSVRSCLLPPVSCFLPPVSYLLSPAPVSRHLFHVSFSLPLHRFNPYTQTVEVLNCSDKILDMAKELKGDLAIVASALRKV